jgi:hypothetical protein
LAVKLLAGKALLVVVELLVEVVSSARVVVKWPVVVVAGWR